MPPLDGTAAMFVGTGIDNIDIGNDDENEMHQFNIFSNAFEQLSMHQPHTNNNTPRSGPTAEAAENQLWPSSLSLDCGGSSDLEDPNGDSAFWAPSLSGPSSATRAPNSTIADLWPQSQQQSQQSQQQSRHSSLSTATWQPRAVDAYGSISSPVQRHAFASTFPSCFTSPLPAKTYHIPSNSLPTERIAVYRDPAQTAQQTQQQYGQCLPSPTMAGVSVHVSSGISPAAWGSYQQKYPGGLDDDNGISTHKQQPFPPGTPLPRKGLGQKDNNSLFSTSFQFPTAASDRNQSAQELQLQLQQNKKTSPGTSATAKTFKPMQMVYRERNRRASASSTGTSSSGGGGSFSPATSPYTYTQPNFAYSAPTQLPTPLPYNPHEQAFRRQQGISPNYRGDINNPHNRGDHVPANANTSLFLMGLPPNTSVGDLLRAVAMLGPTGRIFAASVNPPDPMRRLPLAAAKISYFTRAQAEHFKALVDAHRLVMYSDQNPATPHVVRCSWNRDKKAPRRCVQASECRVLRIRGPRNVVNFGYLTEYFEEKFRYELQDVQVVQNQNENNNNNNNDDETTMEWRFASFQSQAIAAKMALNQERKMVRVEYGQDPCEWGEY